jgi:hypothetical protein
MLRKIFDFGSDARIAPGTILAAVLHVPFLLYAVGGVLQTSGRCKDLTARVAVAQYLARERRGD